MSASDVESLEVLGEKLKAVAKVNQDIIDEIEARKNETVVSGFRYNFHCTLDANEIRKRKPWTLDSTPVGVSVYVRLQNWHYQGEGLEKAEDVFNDNIDYAMNTYDSVKRLNQDLLKVGSKYCDLLADKPKTREGVRTFLKNLEIVQVALGELNGLIIDEKDELKQSANVREGMKEIISGFKKLRKDLDTASLTVHFAKDVDDGDY